MTEMVTYRGRRPTTVPTYAQLRLENEQLRTENAKLLAGDRTSGDENARESESDDRAAAAETRVAELERELAELRASADRLLPRPDAGGGADEPVPPAGVDRDDYETLTVSQLQVRLDARRLPTTGKKSELVDRLRASDERLRP